MKITTFTKVSAFLLLLYVLSSCTDESIDKDSTGGGGHTLTLRLAATVSPIPETKAVVRAARPDSEAAAAGFSYELVSTDTDTTATAPGTPAGFEPLATKAPTTLKNVYALLFTSDGAFNGRADLGALGTVTAGTATDITFTNVATPAATGCRLVIVANDNAAANSYASSGGTGGFSGFSDTYTAFQALILTNTIATDADIPYAGSVTGLDLAAGELGTVVSVSLYRTLAKIVLNNTFSIISGPTRASITLYNSGTRRFATSGTDNYDGTGSTQTTAYTASTPGTNANNVTFYAGENIRPAGGSTITTPADRNSTKAPANACYIRIASNGVSSANTTPKIGEEYIKSGSKSFTYDIYLGKSSVVTDFSLRRHTNYTITSAISGSLAVQEALAAMDGRVTLTATGSAGLVIGRFGGPSSYTTGTGTAPTIFGSYTKLLLLQPNTSGSTAMDNVLKVWGATGTQYQPDTRRYWDKSYIYSITTGGTVGGMNAASGSLYDYCYQLTIGEVTQGTWYVPTQAQLQAIWTVYAGLKETGYEEYAAFGINRFWSCTERDTSDAWYVGFNNGSTFYITKTSSIRVRCVRDL